MQLQELAIKAGVNLGSLAGQDSLGAIKGLSADSRTVAPGFLFAAFPGSQQDGRAYISAAVESGATALLVPVGTEVDVALRQKVHVVESDQPRRLFAKLAAVFYGAQPRQVVAVTGTNGKSSTAAFCRQIWESLNCAAASLGTLGVVAPGFTQAGHLTTPDPVSLAEMMAELARLGVTHTALEASSQGLDQYRIDGVEVAAAGFTNLARDHLDYHSSPDDYYAAKRRLFTEVLSPKGCAVINADETCFHDLQKSVGAGRCLSYGRSGKDIVLQEILPQPQGQTLRLSVFGKSYKVFLPLEGAFQAYNALCALGLVIAEDRNNDSKIEKAIGALENLQGVRGRMEKVAQHPSGAMIYVDYAHTPDGLESLLTALRAHTPNRLHIVFGCGGNRDPGKRPLMGAVAARLADVVIVTDDNPRLEDPKTIRAEVMTGCPQAVNIGDRAQAIVQAIANLQAGDTLVIAGKGHEQGQILGQTVVPFDDAAVARQAVLVLEEDKKND